MVRFSQIQRLNFLTIIFLCLTVQRTFSNQGVGFQQQESVEEFRKLFADFDQVDDGTTQTYSYNYLQTDYSETSVPIFVAEDEQEFSYFGLEPIYIYMIIAAIGVMLLGGVVCCFKKKVCACCRKDDDDYIQTPLPNYYDV
mmetsp:Transcript_1084/g.1411  ORF Transcript_1084/g.1411 Transcript_1084/m.1411 type:complete len:141 (+) Transcript_1084:77-499(+)